MPAANEKVMSLVEKELRKNPKAPTEELFRKAKAEVPEIGELAIRQFHARYPLQVKRRLAPRREPAPRAPRRPGGKTAAAPGPAVDRAAIRNILLQFAKDVAAAEGKPAAIVEVVGGVDRYVEKVIKAAGAS